MSAEQNAKVVAGLEPQAVWSLFAEMAGVPRPSKHEQQIQEFMLKKAKLWLNEGAMFGSGGELFMRINLACPRSILKRALENLEKAVNEL